MLLPRKRNRSKGILSHTVYGSCFCVQRRYIFPLKNMKYKYHNSCQFVETTHLRPNLHACGECSHVHRRQEKAITKFSSHVFESPTFKGSNDS